jgi:hypothetical protein
MKADLKFRVENSKASYRLEVYEWIISNMQFGSTDRLQGPMERSCERSKEFSGTIKYGDFIH